MVARIVTGKSIRGMLIYNEQKVAAGDAMMLMASGFATDAERLSLLQKIERFNKLTKLNSRSKTNAMHISLNFHKDDKLNPQLLQQIAVEYMQMIGFADQPFIAYKHFDTDHPHLHIATTLINKNGDRIKTEAIGKNLSEPARIYIENKYGLIQAKGRKLVNQAYIRVAEYGSKPTKRQIANITQSVKRDYAFTSFPEYKAILSMFRVFADRGDQNTLMYKNNGLLYSIMDSYGNSIGVPIKASSISTAVTIKELEKCYGPNREKRRPKKEDLKNRINKVLQNYHKLTKSTLQKQLAAHQIALIYRQNEHGLIYGMTFIDHKNLTVFNGSDLGKEYSASSMSTILSLEDQLKTGFKKPLTAENSLKTEQPSRINSTILDSLAIKDEPDPLTRGYRKKKKKKGKLPTQNLGL